LKRIGICVTVFFHAAAIACCEIQQQNIRPVVEVNLLWKYLKRTQLIKIKSIMSKTCNCPKKIKRY